MYDMKRFDFHMSAKLLFGEGELKKLGEELAKMNVTKVLVVTDNGLAGTEVFQSVCNQLDTAGIHYVKFTEVEPNPTIRMMDKGAIIYKNEGCDAVIGVGGGSSMDTAKGIAVVVSSGGTVKEYCGAFKIKNQPAPIILIPTTTGTGSETSWHCSVKDEETHFKLSIRSNLIVPALTILDPVLVASLPPRLVAETGMDALSHLFESYTSTNTSRFMDMFAEEGIKCIGSSIRQFYANRKNLKAAANMQYAAMLGGITISHARTGAVHALARPIGGQFGVSHGLAISIMLPHVMQYSWIACPEKYKFAAEALGENIGGLSLNEAAQKAIEAVRQLQKDLGLPRTLSEVGVTEESIPSLAYDAVKTGSAVFNPRVVGQKDLECILNSAL
ncbi:MAG: iron-containing alcohol dehydrogenase [Dehalobacterium sp.]